MKDTPIKLLLVEDNPGDVRLVREALREAAVSDFATPRCELRVETRLEAAINALSEAGIDVVLLDLALPDSEGFATFERVRRCAPDCAIVVLTRNDALGSRAIREGAQDYLSKDQFDPASLARTVRYAVDRKDAERARFEVARAEAARVEADTQRVALQALFDGALDAMLIAGDAGQILEANAAATELLGRSRDELVTLSLSALVPETLRAEEHRSWATLLRDGRQRGELIVVRADGDTRIVDYQATASIQPGRHLSVMRDVTRQVLARREVESANRAKDEFLSVASHELRTPLNAILGWSRLLRSGSLSSEKRDVALETIERNARVQVRLVDDILDVSRIITGKLRLSPSHVAAQEVVAGAVEVVRASAEAKGITLVVSVDDDLGELYADGSRLQQVLWNLLSNAVKFTGKGGKVELRATRAEGALVFSVKDSGSGIEPAFLPHVFDAFRQADATITRSSGGLGLGLAIVKHLVELHGGQVEAESEGLGRGSCFRIRIPFGAAGEAPFDAGASKAPLSAYPDTPMNCPPSLAGLRVLVVDDEPDARELLGSILAECKIEPYFASSAEEALRVFVRERPDMLVSDIGMPGADGYSLIRRIRELSSEDGGRTPAVALTAYTRVEDRTRALMEGFNSHVSKPVEPQDLLSVMASILAA